MYSTDTWEIIDRTQSGDPVDGGTLPAFAGFLPDESTVVGISGFAGLGGGSLLRIDAATLEVIDSARAHEESPKGLAMSPDGTLVAAGASDGLVRVWDAATGALLHQFSVEGQAQGVAFIDDLRLAVTPSGGDLLIFALDPAELLDIVRGSLTRGFTQAECDQFGFADACPTLDELRAGSSASASDRP